MLANDKKLNSSYVKLSFRRDGQNHNVVGGRYSKPNDAEIIKNKFEKIGVGISDLSVKVESQNIIANFKLQIPVQELALVATTNKHIQDLFHLGNNWKLEIGNSDDRVFFRNMRLYDASIEYATGIRGIEINVVLHGLLFSTLNSLRLRNITPIHESSSVYSTGGFTLENLTRTVLEASKEYLEKYAAAPRGSNVPPPPQSIDEEKADSFQGIHSILKKQEYKGDRVELVPEGLGVPNPTNPNIPAFEVTESNQPVAIGDYKPLIQEEDPLYGIDITAIPRFKDIAIVVIAQSPGQAEVAYKRIWQTELIKVDLLDKLFRRESKDQTTVMAYLESTFMDHAYQIIEMPNISQDSSGGLNLLAIPIAAIATVNGFHEYTFKNGSLLGRNSHLSYSNSELDLLSARNVVLSVQADTSRGTDSLQSVMANENLAGAKENAGDVTSIYNVLESTSKTVEIETIGTPGILFYDTIQINFLSNVFTGGYKILSFEHKVDGNKFTTSFEAIRLAKELNMSSNDAENVSQNYLQGIHDSELLDDPKKKISWVDTTFGPRTDKFLAPYETNDFGTEKDIKINPKRYR